VCTAAAALLQLDGAVTTVALPSGAHTLGIRSGSVSVVLRAYFAACALTLLPGGGLVDRFGPRRLVLIGLGLFALGAAAGPFSSNVALLVATRVLQGAGAGLVSPAALAGAISGFPPALAAVGVGVGLLFVRVSRAALNAIPLALHGRVSAVLSVGRLAGAAVGAGLAGVALGGGASAAAVHAALLVACAVCSTAGIPACALLGAAR
jgi:MFS family permease